MIAALNAGLDPTAFLEKAFKAIWEDEADFSNNDVVVAIADAAGLPGRKLLEESASEAVGQQYEQNRQDAIAADVFGSPAYVLDGEVFWGQDRIELFGDALRSGRAPYRP